MARINGLLLRQLAVIRRHIITIAIGYLLILPPQIYYEWKTMILLAILQIVTVIDITNGIRVDTVVIN